VGVKVELASPSPDKPQEGRLEFFVDWFGSNKYVPKSNLFIKCFFDLVLQMQHLNLKGGVVKI
jgi:hypothetical protein